MISNNGPNFVWNNFSNQELHTVSEEENIQSLLNMTDLFIEYANKFIENSTPEITNFDFKEADNFNDVNTPSYLEASSSLTKDDAEKFDKNTFSNKWTNNFVFEFVNDNDENNQVLREKSSSLARDAEMFDKNTLSNKLINNFVFKFVHDVNDENSQPLREKPSLDVCYRNSLQQAKVKSLLRQKKLFPTAPESFNPIDKQKLTKKRIKKKKATHESLNG